MPTHRCRRCNVVVSVADGYENYLISRECRGTKSVGFGDTVAKAAKMVGIKPCGGCEERRKKLNRMFPY